MRRRVIQLARDWMHRRSLPPVALQERALDRRGLPADDPGTERVLPAAMAWMALAQDRSRSNDGGVARDYSLVDGWGSSYPETTGYIIPTFLEYARRTGDTAWRDRALRMANWLVGIQMPGGGFQGGKIDSTPVVPVTFNTGQILLGLVAAERETGHYGEAMQRAADWLVQSQDADGCWRRHPTPFAEPGEKQYETHVAWGLFEAARQVSGRGYGEAGLANVRWALSEQGEDGWFAKCCLTDPTRPLTHTLGYVLRGILEAYRYAGDPELLTAAKRTADGILAAVEPGGRLPGRLSPGWQPAVSWVCLTGSAQLAHCWLMLYQETGERRYLETARAVLSYVRRTVRVEGPIELKGGVKGSFPIDGHYGQYQLLNWAPKFLADALMLDSDIAAAAA